MRVRRGRRRVVLIGAGLVGLAVPGAACTPTPTGSDTQLVCAPANLPLARVLVTVTAAPPGGTVRSTIVYTFKDGSDSVDAEDTFGASAGRTFEVGHADPNFGVIDPGRCLTLGGSAGVSFYATKVSIVDPQILLFYAAGGQAPLPYWRGIPQP